jgi:hypothetical protein
MLPDLFRTGGAVTDMKREQEPVDVTEPLRELVRGVDFAFDQKNDEPITPQTGAGAI